MRKIFSMIILVASFFLCGQEKVFAYDVYCGTYKDGREAYLMTETIKFISYGDASYEEGLNCQVKATKGNSVIYIDYHFDISEGGTVGFTNSQGNSGRFGGVLSRKGSPYPIESEIFENAYKLKPPKRVG
ncbi:MAG: hypothetical protein IKZ58_05975 [Selenomonadaceae bacterium]|nr:hypothetical protein [Selenomonadaceae bacterium]